ncbi:MAG: alpha/beta fold hydrolase [Desulfobulbaceae bacterium]|nr:alpha/beta fold hydrolase [Desulfobulbaceae bacterium]
MLIFLHGLESSGSGTKGRYFAQGYPGMLRPDFSGDLAARLVQLNKVATGQDLVLVGSSYGGLLATVFAMKQPDRVCRLVLLAPAFNFPEFTDYANTPVAVATHIVIGHDDMVTPEAEVVPIARRIFTDLQLEVVDDDHLLHRTFTTLDWASLLRGPESVA